MSKKTPKEGRTENSALLENIVTHSKKKGKIQHLEREEWDPAT